ncbi:rab geranylgeranyl transferase component A [Tribonema minus]|uniref:Rab geranylgeranyl transferase component A n=1 Tax=Tribonema minus TaxID=303371 RepID=A0A835YQC3_9STRA|nr:rab geranylgeranyl transferase component A [Tribonema minus]
MSLRGGSDAPADGDSSGSDGDDNFNGCEGCTDDEVAELTARQRTFILPGIERPLTIIQDFMGIEGTGGTVWRASVMLAEYCCTHLKDAMAGAPVLEIGAGLGLVAIAAWHLGALQVVATDIDHDGNRLLALLAKNISANCQSQERAAPLVRQLWWGNDGELSGVMKEGFGGTPPAVVLACDVLAWPELYPQLNSTLRAACPPRGGGTMYLAHQYRSKERELEFIHGFSDAYEVELVHQSDARRVIFKISPRD